MGSIANEIYAKVKSEIERFTGAYILLEQLQSWPEGIDEDMLVFMQSPEGLDVLREIIERLINEGSISAVGKKKNHYGLPLKFRKVKQASDSSVEVAEIIRSIIHPAAVDYYIRNIEDYNRDKEIIEKICAFLKDECKEIITINERAYELFGDEKFFRGDEAGRSRGEVVLKRLGLDYSQIGCEETFEPFFSFWQSGYDKKVKRNVYIIENRDTFWSFKKYMMDKVDMLIYGEGKKIVSSFRYMKEYGLNEGDGFYYFGDLDAEGVNILGKLQDEYSGFKIVPFREAYLALLEIGFGNGLVKSFKNQRINEGYCRRFAGYFDSSDAKKIMKVLDGGYYIPQEALRGTEMRERFEVLW